MLHLEVRNEIWMDKDQQRSVKIISRFKLLKVSKEVKVK